MISYLIVILIPIILYVTEDIIPTKNKIFRKLAIGYIIFITSIRYNFGYDYQVYLNAFNTNQLPFEIGYSFLNKIIRKMELSFNWVLLIISMINYILLYLVIEREVVRFKWLSMFCFLTYFDLFFYSLSAIRQSVAISIFLYSIKYIRENKLKKYILSILLASFFHKTAIILIFFKYIYIYLKKKSILKLNLIVMVSGLIYFLLIKSVLNIIKPFLSRRYIYYFFLDDSYKNKFSIFIFIIIVLITVIFINFIKFDEKENKSISWIAIYVYLILKIFQSIKYYSILPRIQFYFYPFYILLIPVFIQKIKKNKKKMILIILIFQMLFFIYKYKRNSKVIYYETYNTIFTR